MCAASSRAAGAGWRRASGVIYTTAPLPGIPCSLGSRSTPRKAEPAFGTSRREATSPPRMCHPGHA